MRPSKHGSGWITLSQIVTICEVTKALLKAKLRAAAFALARARQIVALCDL